VNIADGYHADTRCLQQYPERREVEFFADHERSATPRLYEIRRQLATRYGANEELVFVKSLRTLTGTNRTVGEVEVYDLVEDAKSLTPRHIVARNLPERHKTAKEGEGKSCKFPQEKESRRRHELSERRKSQIST